MLALLGVFGVMMAGLAADALLSSRSGEEEPSDDVLAEDDQSDLGDGDLLDGIGGDTTIPTSDDIPDTADEAQYLKGGDEADLLSGAGADDTILAHGGADLIDGLD